MRFEEENKTININGSSVLPGENKLLRIAIARLPTGTLIDISVHVFNGKHAGPIILLQAGLHGDEINGVETLRRMLENDDFQLIKGAVIVVPILNVFGFIHFSRDVPDGKDVNRSFPGRKSGSLASRIAYYFTQEILPQGDFGLDLHTGGGQRNNFPQIRYTEGDKGSQLLATYFNAPFSFASNLIQGSFRKTAHKMGKPIAVYEAGESMRFDENAITTGIIGIKKILRNFGMIEGPMAKNKSIVLTNRKWLRAPRAGMFIPKIENGGAMKKGTIIGRVTDTYAKKYKSIKAPFDGYVICINHQAVVNQGDALFHIGR
ncbi:MAG: succinylglutamate desuccinylase/aspartoacylase family protein [Croceivirga sp.]